MYVQHCQKSRLDDDNTIAFINGKAESACNRVKEIIWTYQKQEITVTKEVRNETKRDFYRKTMLEIHCRKQNDPGIPLAYQSSLAAGQIHVVYLDELTDTSSSIGLEIIQLVVAPEDEAIQTARSLINLVQQADAANSLYLLELVERMLIYKFSTYTRQELEPDVNVCVNPVEPYFLNSSILLPPTPKYVNVVFPVYG